MILHEPNITLGLLKVTFDEINFTLSKGISFMHFTVFHRNLVVYGNARLLDAENIGIQNGNGIKKAAFLAVCNSFRFCPYSFNIIIDRYIKLQNDPHEVKMFPSENILNP
jgi:hypothetical protein